MIELEAKNPNNAYGLSQMKNKKTGKGRAFQFMKADYKKYKEEIKEIAENAMGEKSPCQGNIYVDEVWEFGTKRRKDLCNCGKLEFDALNGVVYEDDQQIVMQTRCKIYSKNEPCITLNVYELLDYDGWDV